MSYFQSWRPYVSVAERRRNAAREMGKLRQKGHPVSPVTLEGRTIARTFWGKAWCDHLEHYSDFANRLPRGRRYVRNGSVVDLQVTPGEVRAFVSGSELYEVSVKVSAVPRARWTRICSDCSGAIDSLVELLQGRFSKGVMERICEAKTGLFPSPAEIDFSCSCPDWASMCKHVAAVLYGIGARFDDKPELLFLLREVDAKELIAKAGKGVPLSKRSVSDERLLAVEDLSDLFGLELGASSEPELPIAQPAPRAARRASGTAKRSLGASVETRRAKAPKPKATPSQTRTKPRTVVTKTKMTQKRRPATAAAKAAPKTAQASASKPLRRGGVPQPKAGQDATAKRARHTPAMQKASGPKSKQGGAEPKAKQVPKKAQRRAKRHPGFLE